ARVSSYNPRARNRCGGRRSRAKEARALRREDLDRRRFLGTVAASAAAIPAFGARAFAADPQPAPKPSGEPPVRFAVVGINHAHIYGQTDALLRGGGEL